MKNKNIKVDPRNLISINEYASQSGKTVQTIYNWLKEGKIKKIKFLGKDFIDKSSYNG